MAISAADLERIHADATDPTDPFPDTPAQATYSAQATSSSRPAPGNTLDTSSETAFPSLAAPSPKPGTPVNGSGKKPAPRSSQWSAGSGAIKSGKDAKDKGKGKATPVNGTTDGPLVRPSLVTESLVIASPVLQPKQTLGEVCKGVMKKFSVTIDPSSQSKGGVRETTFYIKGAKAEMVEEAKKALYSMLSPVETKYLDAPVSTIGTIIGPKGASLKTLRDKYDVRVDVPRRETAQNGHGTGDAATPAPLDGEEPEEPTVRITVTGPAPGVQATLAALSAIVATKTSRTSTRVSVPVHFWPFVAAKKDELEAGNDVRVTVPRPVHHIEEEEGEAAAHAASEAAAVVVIAGEREAVAKVSDRVRQLVEDLESNTNTLKFSVPKRQHRFLVGDAARKILEQTGCSVELAPYEDPSDEVVIRGPNEKLSTALGAVMAQANTATVQQVDLLTHSKSAPAPPAHAAHLLTYLTRSGRLRRLAEQHSGVKFFAPRGTSLTVDIVGEDKASVDKGREELVGIVKALGPESFLEMEVEPLTHRYLIGKKGQKLKAFQDAHGVDVLFPPESAESPLVLLVHTRPTDASLDKKAREAEVRARLEDVKQEVEKLAKEAADVKSETLQVERKWHRFVVGQGGTTLNGIIGEDKAIIVKVGSHTKPGAAPAGKEDPDENTIVVRGPKDQVDRAVKEILQIVEDAKNDDIVNGYTEEFNVNRDYVGRIVGTGGSGLNKLRDELGVRIDISDQPEPAGGMEEVKGKKKKKPESHATVKIVGRKENVLKAKERIFDHVEKMADETTETLKILAQYHPSLIGQGGKYAVRLEDKYGVKITFPRQNEKAGEEDSRRRDHEPVGKDEVLIRGGKQGVAGAKAELMEAVEFEKESNNTLKFTVPASAIARIVGKGGQQINDIKDQTEATIDIDRPAQGVASATASVTVRGTKKATEAAKAAILAIASEIDDEVTVVVPIESKYHRAIIGAGGNGLRELVTRCGGPADPRTQASLVHFPRQGETQDEVRLRGNRQLVEKIKAELEKVATGYRDRVVLAVSVPVALHSALIGRAGKRLQELQDTTGAQIQFPGSRSYGAVGEPENAEEVKDSNPLDVVKVYGTRAACEKAITELKQSATTFGTAAPGRSPRAAHETFTSLKPVPLKYHHVISQGGQFFRNLRSFGVTIDHSVVPEKPEIKPPGSGSAPEARIDQPLEAPSGGAQWDVVPNYESAPDGDAEWTLRARDKAGLERAENELDEAIKNAATYTHIGFLTLPDRSMFPRIVGSKGATITRIREDTGANIDVGRDNNTIMITGSESSIKAAKEAIEQILTSGRRDSY